MRLNQNKGIGGTSSASPTFLATSNFQGLEELVLPIYEMASLSSQAAEGFQFVVHPLGCPRFGVPMGLKSALKGGQQTAVRRIAGRGKPCSKTWRVHWGSSSTRQRFGVRLSSAAETFLSRDLIGASGYCRRSVAVSAAGSGTVSVLGLFGDRESARRDAAETRSRDGYATRQKLDGGGVRNTRNLLRGALFVRIHDPILV